MRRNGFRYGYWDEEGNPYCQKCKSYEVDIEINLMAMHTHGGQLLSVLNQHHALKCKDCGVGEEWVFYESHCDECGWTGNQLELFQSCCPACTTPIEPPPDFDFIK